MTANELKALACSAIDENKEMIISLGEAIADEPELGFKEFKTAKKVKDALSSLSLTYRDGVAITGIITEIKGRKSDIRVSVMGELDAVTVPKHKRADPITGAAHCCGHNVQSASVVGVAVALAKTDIMKHLDGDVVLMHVPAEEGVELAYRKSLIDDGILKLPEGKAEFIYRGEFDDIDMMIMQHTSCTENSGNTAPKATCGGMNGALGVVSKMIKYTGKASHAARPHEGINALNAAQLGLMGINAQRETFKDEDNIRVHPIITKGGDLVNVVPDDVRIETYVRGSNNEGIVDAAKKVDNALMGGAMAIGATCEIINMPICMAPFESEELKDVCYDNLRYVFGDQNAVRDGDGVSSDAGDVSNIIPSVHMMIGGAGGVLHGDNFEIANKELAYISSAKAMVCSVIDLLYDDAKKAKHVKANFKAPYTKEQYFKEWCKI